MLLQFDGGAGIDYDRSAGWSSLVARWAHNPKVGGSNPPPATKFRLKTSKLKGADFKAPFFFARNVRVLSVFSKKNAGRSYWRNAVVGIARRFSSCASLQTCLRSCTAR